MVLRALVIDDSKMMRKIVMEHVRQTNLGEFQFTEAEDGADALSKFDPAAFDVILADWNMPRMSGLDFVHKVRSMRGTDHIGILMVTSERTVGKMELAMDKAQADGYLCKPFTVEEMQRKLARVLMKRAPQRSQQPAAKTGTAKGGFFSKLVEGL